ncbi:hypothetical protein PCASD_17975 [Puccinia coronata f. sp. avenae]|uniref:Uncharacterized protein n=1 Tax=Puccinia coronata f. sp. avenae TaxID=200324 RepID=A0A2N5STN5_9BASI|nr:hypothetical protein PCASD_17975 [Puccinia coronata f. sp. avenae]
MASEANKLIADKTDVEINLADNHIQCFCHKIELILTGGLQAIGLEVTTPAQKQQSTLGFFLQLVPIIEESKKNNADNKTKIAEIKLDDNVVAAANKGSQQNDDEANGDGMEPPSLKEGSTINLIFKKCITSSSSRRSEFETWAKKLDYTGPNPIAGYGIWWNIKFQSHDCEYKA